MIIKNALDESKFECKRCGSCCIQFSSQIMYIIEPEEENWSKLADYYKHIVISFNQSNQPKTNEFPFRVNRGKKIGENENKKKFYFIPTKLEYLAYKLKIDYNKKENDEKKNKKEKEKKATDYFNILIKFSEFNHANECLFLTEKEGITECTINNNHPKMCDDYPSNKGDVCLNQKERYFTKKYLNFKKESVKREIEVINKIFPYFSEHNLDSLTIITFLMDFGVFQYDKVENFFITKIGWIPEDFKYAIKDLQRFGLLFGTMKNDNRVIESISSSSLKKKIELTIK
ncbi:MAG: hypothetical protein GY870_19500 [archaeon]|nr:hypothetical protein [archaeon]